MTLADLRAQSPWGPEYVHPAAFLRERDAEFDSAIAKLLQPVKAYKVTWQEFQGLLADRGLLLEAR